MKSPPTPLASPPSVTPLACLLATLLAAVCTAAPAALAPPLAPISPITSFLDIPRTTFTCDKQPVPGIYADTDTGCQVFHFCQDGGRNSSFFCPNLTLFNQQYFVCDWSYNVDCASAPLYYSLNTALYSHPERISQALTPAIKIAGQEELLVGSASSSEVSRTSNTLANQQDTRILDKLATQLDNVNPSTVLDTERKGRLLVLPGSKTSDPKSDLKFKEKLETITEQNEAFESNSIDIAAVESQSQDIEVARLTLSGEDAAKSNSEEDNLEKSTSSVPVKDQSEPNTSGLDTKTQPRSGRLIVSPTVTTTQIYSYEDTYSDPEPTPLDYDDVEADPEPSAGSYSPASWDAADPEPVAIPDSADSRVYSQPSLSYSQPSSSYSELSSGYSQSGLSNSQPSVTYSQPSSSYSQPDTSYSQPSASYSQPSATYSQISQYDSADPEPAAYYGYYDSADPEPASFYGADTIDLSSSAYDDDAVSDPEPDPSTGFYYSESPSQDLADPEPVANPEFAPFSRR